VDSITIDRTTSIGVFNPATGNYDTPVTVNKYTGNALIRPISAADKQYGQQLDTRNTYLVAVPHDTTDVALEDVVTVVAATLETVLDGDTLTITGIDYDTYNTHRVLTAELDVTP
jgi:hypothetical protein